jgi:transposase-like protein
MLRLVQMYLNGGASLNGPAPEHDISCILIRAWVDNFHKGELSERKVLCGYGRGAIHPLSSAERTLTRGFTG